MRKKAIEVIETPEVEVADPAVVTVSDVTDAALGLLKAGLDALHIELTAIINGTAAETKHDRASRIAHLTKQVGSIADAMRKVESARAKRLELTPAAVLAYLRSCDARSRRLVLSELEVLSNGGSVLG